MSDGYRCACGHLATEHDPLPGHPCEICDCDTLSAGIDTFHDPYLGHGPRRYEGIPAPGNFGKWS